MKKNYFFTLLLTFCFSAISFGQVTNGDFESWTGDAPDGWTSESGTTITEETTIFHGGTSSAKFSVTTQTQSNTDFRQSISVEAGKVYDVSLWVYQADNQSRARIYFDGYQGYSDPATIGSWQEVTYEYTANATGSIDIGLRFYDTGDWAGGPSVIYIDDYTVTEQVSTSPSLLITAPTDGTTFNPGTTSVDVTLNVQNFNFSANNGSGLGDGSGDGFIKQTLVTPSGTFVESKYDANTQMISVANGESYTITMELVDNAGASLTTPVSKTATFSVASITQVANLAALRAGTSGDYYEVTGQIIMTYDAGGSRNQKYMQDATGGILIDDSAGTITTSYNVGDANAGVKGRLSSFSGVLQFVPMEDPGTPEATGQSFTTTSVTLNDFITNFENYESQWVKIQSATFDDADGTAVFDSNTTQNYGITEGADMAVVRLQFGGTNIEGTQIPQGSVNITGIAAQFNTTLQIFPTEISGIVLDVEKNNISGFSTYPNPITNNTFTVATANSDKKEVVIFNVLGKKVFSSTFTGLKKNIDVSAITSGIYILKVTENGKTATKKLVIR